MNWISIGIGAAAGLVAALLAHLVVRKPQERKIAYGVVFVVAFVFLNTLARENILPTLNNYYEAEKAEETLLKIPAYQELKQHDPNTYQVMLSGLREGLRKGSSEEELIAQVKTNLGPLIEKRVPYASDQAVVTYMGVVVKELRELNRQDPSLCYRFLFPQQYGAINPQKYLSKQLLSADLAALAEVIRTSATDPQPAPTEQDVAADLEIVVGQLQEQYGDSVSVLQNPQNPSVDKRVACGMIADLYTRVLELPSPRGGRLLRFMLSQA